MLSERIIRFYFSLPSRLHVPNGVEVLSVYQDPEVRGFVEAFYSRYYHDERPRTLVLGINPGRLGGGMTGIPFTDPVRLSEDCGIANQLEKRTELSSDFIYRMIRHLGGPAKFFGKNLLSAVCPLGFTRAGKNINYYDDPELLDATRPFILDTLQKQFALGVKLDTVILLGEGQNAKHFLQWNRQYGFCRRVVSLPHPRFIMQYKRKALPEYLDRYAAVLA